MKTPPLALEAAQERLLAMAQPVTSEVLPVEAAQGRYLAEALIARRTQPPADLSAMDGYALHSADMAGPWRVIGESAAGHAYAGSVGAGEAVRISTGAALPGGADAVILQEDLARDGDTITLTGEAPVPPGKHIRRRGMDFAHGHALLSAGTRIGPAQAALALAGGHGEVAVRRRLRVAVIDSGDELAAAPESCAPHQIPASNGVMLAAMIAALPCDVVRIGPVADDMAALATALAAADGADVIVTSGGASVGDHDLVRPALEAWGAEIDFWRVAIKPGKPILVARKDAGIVLGLPGNPVSSYVTAYLFLLPLLCALQGAASPLPRAITASLGQPLAPGGSRREFLRAHWDGTSVAALALQDSGALTSLARANALIDRAAMAVESPAGTPVRVYLLENGGIA